MKISREGVLLIKSFEGFHPRAWQGSDGRWVVGYGHTASTQEGSSVSQADAELLLQYDLIPVQSALAAHLTRRVNQHQYDALASFAFSVGPEAFARSEVLTRVNAGEDADAVEALAAWPEAPVREAGLRRRAAERALFNADPSAPVALADLLSAPIAAPAPTPHLVPAETQLPEAVNDDAVETPVAPVTEDSVTEDPLAENLMAETSASTEIPILAPTVDALPPTVGTIQPASESQASTTPAAAVLTETAGLGQVVSMPLPEDAAQLSRDPAETSIDLTATTAPYVPTTEMAEATPTVVTEIAAPESPVSAALVPEAAITRPHLAWPLEEAAPQVDAPVQAVADAVVAPESVVGAATTELQPLSAGGVTPATPQEADTTTALFDDTSATEAVAEDTTQDTSQTVGWGEPFDRKPAGFSWRRVWAYMVMGGFGLVSLAMAMAALRKASMAQSDVTSILVIAGVLAFIGAACVGVSAHNIYRRLSDDS